MIVHLVPVGISIVQNLERGAALPATATNRERILRSVREVLADLRSRFEADEPDDVARSLLTTSEGREWLERYQRALDLRAWDSALSAEVRSLDVVRRNPGQASGPEAVLLLATDTSEGLIAAVLNALALTSERISYADSPQQLAFTAGSPVPAVHVVRIPGMDLKSQKSFDESMEHLGRLGRVVHDTAGGDAYLTVHLSGGYKASIPFVLALAEGLRTLRGGSPRVRACCLHESTTDEKPLVWVPVRFFSSGELGSLRTELEKIKAGRYGESAALEGYAWEQDGTSRILTSFGRGLLQLLSPANPARRDVIARR